MVAPNITPPHSSSTVPPSSASVVPIRPKPPAFPAISNVSRPVIIEQDVVDYLVKAPIEQRWRILSKVAMATADETASALASSAPPPPASDRPSTAAPPPAERSAIVPAAPASEPRGVASPAPVPLAIQTPVAAAPPPSQRRPMVVVPPPSQRPSATPPASAERPQLELVDQTREAVPAPHAVPRPSPSSARPVAVRAASSAPPEPSTARASSAPPASSAPSAPPPASAVDHAEELFAAMHELTLFESAPAGARFCLEALLEAVPSLAGLVHLRDPASLELVVVHAQGPRADGLQRARTPLSDALVTRAARAGKPTVVTYGAEPGCETTMCPRHGFFDPWSVVLVPIMHGGQLLGLFEMIDPIEGNPHDEQAQGALAYVASRLGRFLADHGTELGARAR